MKNKKNFLIILGIILILAIIIIAIITKNNNQNTNISSKPTISDFSKVFELENIDNSNYKIEKSKDVKVAEKYIASNAYKLDANVEFGERAGEIIYLRNSSNKINIFQTKYRIDELGSISSQVENYMEIFKNEALSYIGISEDEKGYNQTLLGTDKSGVKLPLGESIYNEKRLYSITYKDKDTESEGKNYEINFYRNENYLVCEFVKVF